MTTLNIPGSPSPGNTYEANGVVYTWDGSKWKADSSYVSNLNGGQLAGFRNQLINGDFNIWQRGTSFPKNSASEYAFRYTADRWQINGTVADASLAAGLPGFASGIYISNVTGGLAYIVQNIETGPVTNDFCQFVAGSTWTLSYWMRDNTSGTPSIDFRGNANGANLVSWTATGPVEEIETQGNWKRYSRTFTAATYVQGQHDRATVYIPASSSANTLFTGCQLEPGPLATPFEHRPIGTELALCQRYYQSFSGSPRFTKRNDDSNQGKRALALMRSVVMRATPTEAGSASGGGSLSFPESNETILSAECASNTVNSTPKLINYTADAEL